MYNSLGQSDGVLPVLNSKIGSEREKFSTRASTTLVPVLSHTLKPPRPDPVAERDEDDDVQGTDIETLMAEAMSNVASTGDGSAPPSSLQDTKPMRASKEHEEKFVLKRQDTHAVVVLQASLPRVPTADQIKSSRESLPLSLRGFECECLMEFYLPKDVARKVHCVEAALPEEVAMHSTLEKVTNFGTHCRVTAHTRIYVGRGLARYDVLVPPFGVFTFFGAGGP